MHAPEPFHDTPWLKKQNLPNRACDHWLDLPTLPQQALFYRLNGDYNPLHADPETTRQAGFSRPILHGLCTFAMAAHAIVRLLCLDDPFRLQRIEGRFSAPVYPGESLRTEVWHQEDCHLFRIKAMPRDVVVFSHGLAQLHQ